MVLTNYKCTKSLYFSTLRYNYLPKKNQTKQKRKNNMYFFNTRLARIFFFFFFFVEIRAFTIVELKN